MRYLTSDRGLALVSSVLVTMGVLTVVGGLLFVGRASVDHSLFQERRTQAYYAAESGVNDALALLKVDGSALPLRDPAHYPALPSLARSNFPGPGVGYSVWVYEKGDMLELLSEGWSSSGSDGRSQSRSLTVTLGHASPFRESLVLGGTGYPEVTFTEANCSCRGATTPFATAYAVTNLEGNHAYKSMVIDQNRTVNLTGAGSQTLCVDDDLTLRASSRLNVGGRVVVQVSGDLILESGSTISTAADADVEFWVWGSVRMASHSTWQDLGAPSSSPAQAWPRVFVKGGLSIENNSGLGADSHSRPLVILASTAPADAGAAFSLHNSADIHGCVFAPTRDLILDKNWSGYVHGSLVLGTLGQDNEHRAKQLAHIAYWNECQRALIGGPHGAGRSLALGVIREIR